MVQHALEASSGPHSLDEKLIGVSTEAPLASKRQLPSGGIFHAYSQGTNGEVHVYRSPPMQEWTKMVVYSGIEEVKRQEDGAPSAYGAVTLPKQQVNHLPIESHSLRQGDHGDHRKRSLPGTTANNKRRKFEDLSFMVHDRYTADARSELELHDDTDEGSVSNERFGSEGLGSTGTLSMPIPVEDLGKIEEYIDIRFRLMQQTNCKTIAKAWIGKREPQKQTTHPYNGRKKRGNPTRTYDLDNVGESTKPDWWPPTEGWPYKGCRHREPDHIKKSERLILLKHLLFSAKPDTLWTVGKLRQATGEVSHKLKPFAIEYLEDIYDVWEKYQRYEKGEIDGTTLIPLDFPTLPNFLGTSRQSGAEQVRVLPPPSKEGAFSPDSDVECGIGINGGAKTKGKIQTSYGGISDDEFAMHEKPNIIGKVVREQEDSKENGQDLDEEFAAKPKAFMQPENSSAKKILKEDESNLTRRVGSYCQKNANSPHLSLTSQQPDFAASAIHDQQPFMDCISAASSTSQFCPIAQGYRISQFGPESFLRISHMPKPCSVDGRDVDNPIFSANGFLRPLSTHCAIANDPNQHCPAPTVLKEESISPDTMQRPYEEVAMTNETLKSAENFMSYYYAS